MKKRLIGLVGESGSGKNLIAEKLESGSGIRQIIGYTTRPQKYIDEPGYFFVDEIVYNKHKELGIILEETKIYGYRYWSTELLFNYDGDRSIIVDPIGAKTLTDKLKNTEVYMIYIKTDAQIRKERIIKRALEKNISYEEAIIIALKRISDDLAPFHHLQCTHVVDNNGNIKDTIKAILDIIGGRNNG